MARVRSRDTSPEKIVRRALWSSGLRYRLHVKQLPGCPDIVFPSKRVALFVHGCFWHGHEGCPRYRIPKTRTDYWLAKIGGNQARDVRTRLALEAMGWTVLIIWECETKDAARLAAMSAMIKSA